MLIQIDYGNFHSGIRVVSEGSQLCAYCFCGMNLESHTPFARNV